MSLMAKAMGAKVGNPLRKLVLLKLADNANDAGECWPSMQHIADQCEISKSSVKNHIRALADAGFLTIEQRKGVKGNSSNIYKLTSSTWGSSCPRAGDDLGVGQELPPEPVTLEPVIEPKDMTPAKPSKPKRPPIAKNLSAELWQQLGTELEPELLADFIAHRQSKRAAITNTALKTIITEAQKADWSLSQAITELISRDWKGFKAEWVNKESGNENRQANHSSSKHGTRYESQSDRYLRERGLL